MDTLTDVVIALIYSLVLNYKDLAAVHKAAYLSVRRRDEHSILHPPPSAQNHTVTICVLPKE